MDASEIISTVGGSSGIAAALIVLGPKVLDAWRSRGRDEAEVVKTRVREGTARHRTEHEGTALAAELVRERADEHRACREEVAELRVSVLECQRKHGESEARASALETVVADLRGVVQWMQTQVEQLRRDSQRPTQDPAE